MQVSQGYMIISVVEHEQLLNRVAILEERIKEQEERIKELEAMLHKNSHNSHKPPSSDGYKKRTQNNREKSGRKAGGQNGHKGTNLEMIINPDHIVENKVTCCEHCGQDLTAVKPKKYHRGQVHDIPPVKIEVTEHRAEVKQCPACHKETVAKCDVPFSAQWGSRIKSLAVYFNQYQMLPFERTREMMEDLYGACPSAEVLQQSNESCYNNIEQTVEEEIKGAIIGSPVMHNDETGIRCESKLQWIHVHSTQAYTYYAIDEKRGGDAMERIGILPLFQGNSVHDRWASYNAYTNCTHSYCNAHLSRELKAEEENNSTWTTGMKTVLLDAFELSQQQVNGHQIADIEGRYDTIVAEALSQEPLPKKNPHKRGRVSKSTSLRLLECFRDDKEKVLRFLHDTNVPFDNNLAERDLRMVKLKQKISGCFRTRKGAEVFCRIRSFISTVKKQGGQVWESLQLVVNHTLMYKCGVKTAQIHPISIRAG